MTYASHQRSMELLQWETVPTHEDLAQCQAYGGLVGCQPQVLLHEDSIR